MLRYLPLIAVLWVHSCRQPASVPEVPPPSQPERMYLTSPAFEMGGPIPEKYTCLGDGISPALAWSPPPPGTKSLVVTLARLGETAEDTSDEGTVLWVIYNLPPNLSALPEGASQPSQDELPSVRGVNHFGTAGYDGPCPPAGEPARYAFRIFALRTRLSPGAHLSGEALLETLDEHLLGRGELVGTFGYDTR